MAGISSFLSAGAQQVILQPLPGSNGFFRRKLITTTGASSFIVPDGVLILKAAIFGAGGSGAAFNTNWYNSQNYPFGYGGAGGGFCQINELSVVPGETLSLVVGAGGAVRTAINSSPYKLAGFSGGTSSLSRGATVLGQATGGAGGPVATSALNSSGSGQPASALTGGGVGSLGDINTKGGGSNHYLASGGATYGYNVVPIPGGGSSGTPWGDGKNGGCGWFSSSDQAAKILPGAGGGWATEGSPGVAVSSSTSYRGHAGGGGTLEDAPEVTFWEGNTSNYNSEVYALGRAGKADVQIFAGHKRTYNYSISYDNSRGFIIAGQNDWWDVDDFAGYGSAYETTAGPGAGGGSSVGRDGLVGGLGGGGGGGGDGRNGGDGGKFGGGGGAAGGSSTTIVSGKGGDGAIILWW